MTDTAGTGPAGRGVHVYEERSLIGALPALGVPAEAPLQRRLDGPSTEEIWINERLTADWFRSRVP